MYAPYEQAAASRSPIMKILIRKWDYRYPRVFVAVHFAAAAVLVPFGVIMCAYGWAPIGLADAGGGGACTFWLATAWRQPRSWLTPGRRQARVTGRRDQPTTGVRPALAGLLRFYDPRSAGTSPAQAACT